MKALVNKVWPMTVAVAAFIAANLDAIATLIQGELSKAGGKFNATSLLFILTGLITMVNVWSKDSARKLAASQPHSLDNKVV